MNPYFKTLCSATLLCFAGNAFAIAIALPKDTSSNSGNSSRLVSVNQRNSRRPSLDVNDLLGEIMGLRQINAASQRQLKTLKEENANLRKLLETREKEIADLQRQIKQNEEKGNSQLKVKIRNRKKSQKKESTNGKVVKEKNKQPATSAEGFSSIYEIGSVKKLIRYCRKKGIPSNLNFHFEILSGNKFKCTITINDEEYKKDDLIFNSREEAGNVMADYTLNELIKKERESAQNDKNLNTNVDDTLNSKVSVGDQIYDQHLHVKSKKAAKNVSDQNSFSEESQQDDLNEIDSSSCLSEEDSADNQNSALVKARKTESHGVCVIL
ncbi:MAG: DUF3450 domain-containing protein [Alphaproteobacteria bacterium]|nr:DUF3450 domain-containing protein [Alphaproteobacteria bacterium]